MEASNNTGAKWRDWVHCPVCGETDMRMEVEDGNRLIFCTNHNCASNGGTNVEALAHVSPAMVEAAAQAFFKADGANSLTNAQMTLALKAALGLLAATQSNQAPDSADTAHAEAGDSYEAPAHGWTCFHCGDTFTTFGSARDHFGTTPVGVPGCIIKAGEERGILMALRKLEARHEELRLERDSLVDQLEAALGVKADLLRLVKGAKSVHDVWCHLEANYGRAKAAEEVLAAVEKRNPELVNEARVEVCGPGTYYPVSSGVPLERPAQELRGPLEEALQLVDVEFSTWWEDHGQFVRAGGGDYESSFAYSAWEAALKQAAFKLKVASHHVDMLTTIDHEDAARQEAGRLADAELAARAQATLRWVINVMGHLKPAVAAYEQPSLIRATSDLKRLLSLYAPAPPVLAPTITGASD